MCFHAFMLPSQKKVGESWVSVVCELFGERERKKKVGEGRVGVGGVGAEKQGEENVALGENDA